MERGTDSLEVSGDGERKREFGGKGQKVRAGEYLIVKTGKAMS